MFEVRKSGVKIISSTCLQGSSSSSKNHEVVTGSHANQEACLAEIYGT